MAWCLVKAQGQLYLYLYYGSALAHKALYVMQSLAQKLITELEHPPCSPDFAPNDLCLFPKIKSALRRFRDIEGIITNVTTALKAISQQEFQKCFQQ
jgi:hypothetical protein